MDMIEALTQAKNTYTLVHDGDAEQYEQELSAGTYPERIQFLLGRMIRDALIVEAMDKAIDFIESRGLIDKAATLRYKALGLANEKIKELENELKEVGMTKNEEVIKACESIVENGTCLLANVFCGNYHSVPGQQLPCPGHTEQEPAWWQCYESVQCAKRYLEENRSKK